MSVGICYITRVVTFLHPHITCTTTFLDARQVSKGVGSRADCTGSGWVIISADFVPSDRIRLFIGVCFLQKTICQDTVRRLRLSIAATRGALGSSWTQIYVSPRHDTTFLLHPSRYRPCLKLCAVPLSRRRASNRKLTPTSVVSNFG